MGRLNQFFNSAKSSLQNFSSRILPFVARGKDLLIKHILPAVQTGSKLIRDVGAHASHLEYLNHEQQGVAGRLGDVGKRGVDLTQKVADFIK